MPGAATSAAVAFTRSRSTLRSSARAALQDLVALDDALQLLRTAHPRKSQVVELKFFGGLTFEEAAEALGVSVDTVKRDWRFAKLWLLRELSE